MNIWIFRYFRTRDWEEKIGLVFGIDVLESLLLTSQISITVRNSSKNKFYQQCSVHFISKHKIHSPGFLVWNSFLMWNLFKQIKKKRKTKKTFKKYLQFEVPRRMEINYNERFKVKVYFCGKFLRFQMRDSTGKHI